MKKNITIILSIIIVFQLIYYFNSQLRFFPAKKVERKKYVSNVDALALKGWIEQVKFLENITTSNSILSLDNTFGHAKNSYFNYINRMDAIPYKKGINIELQLKKIKGDKISVNFVTAIPDNNNEWWTMKEGIEVWVMDGDLYINYFVENRKNKDELYYIGILPNDGFITLNFSEGGIIFVKDKEGNELGSTMFSEDPFKEVSYFYLGLTASPNSALDISRFHILTPNE